MTRPSGHRTTVCEHGYRITTCRCPGPKALYYEACKHAPHPQGERPPYAPQPPGTIDHPYPYVNDAKDNDDAQPS